MDWKAKRVYEKSLFYKQDVARRTKSNGPGDNRRKCTYVYHLKIHSERLLVCKEKFLSTLGLNEKMVYNWLESEKHGISIPTKVSAVDSFMPDRARASRFTDRLKRAKEFLDSLPKGRHEEEIHRTYVFLCSIADLHVEYKRKVDEESESSISYQKFVEVFNEMDLRHDAGTINETDYNEHIKRKDDAKDSKAADKSRAATDNNIKVLTVDLQSLLVCPKLNASAIYYKMKLSCHKLHGL
ncbi:hypothetical protein MAR_020755 [Mya arenaria]|uniref:Uncharacterized protein n=1 Tax=Mya arenaria TaxID=6604 RepID=A0ABY7E9U0_MYAAR|nr:hypothetical protein MAR_020755 [Mya arenaria]